MRSTDDLPSKSQIFDYWKNRLRDLGFFIDWGEPDCWACGFHYSDKYDIQDPHGGWDKILQYWENIPLQRCHITPRHLGGANDVANFFLMCRECHDLAPNSSIPEIFFEWARHQSWHMREASKIEAAFKSFGVDKSAQEKLSKLMESDGFRSWVSGKMGLHRPQSSYAPTSSRLTPATLIGLVVHYQRLHSSSS